MKKYTIRFEFKQIKSKTMSGKNKLNKKTATLMMMMMMAKGSLIHYKRPATSNNTVTSSFASISDFSEIINQSFFVVRKSS